VQERFAMTRREAFRQGVDGAVLDLMLLHQPWGFRLGPPLWWCRLVCSVSTRVVMPCGFGIGHAPFRRVSSRC
jgi:hypothetical protein